MSSDIFDEDLQPVTPVRKRTISITSEPVTAILVKVGGSKRLYSSKKEARRKVAWRILYDTGRLNKGDLDTFFNGSPKSTWANKAFECGCVGSISTYAGEIDGYDSRGCQLHNRYNGYYKRLHERIVRWLAKGYIAPESGLKDDSND